MKEAMSHVQLVLIKAAYHTQSAMERRPHRSLPITPSHSKPLVAVVACQHHSCYGFARAHIHRCRDYACAYGLSEELVLPNAPSTQYM
jgi:hypothetical protein